MTSNGTPNTPDKIDILIDQVGHFTEGLTELKLLVQAQAETAQKQLEAIDKQGERLDQLAKTVQQQSHSIDRIAAAMEATNHSQSEAINRLTGIIDRLLPPLP
jgi:methyl-accepting chemotaxis protein